MINLCCHKKGETEPEISSNEIKSYKINTLSKNTKINNNHIYNNMKPNIIIDNTNYFINKINKIGNILDSDFYTFLPNYILTYIEKNPYEYIDKRMSEHTTISLTETENIHFSKPIQLKNNNIIYLGEWTKEGVINGKGKMFQPENETYIEGEWLNGCLKYGRIINNKSIYIGNIEDNQYHGKGKYFEFKGDSYEGFFLFGKKNGEGKYIFSDGCIYEGNFENNEINGYGEFNWNNGNYYKGEFYKGIFHGNGYLKWKNGNVYKGEFKNGFFHGSGIYFWKNKDEYYKGEYLNNNKNGKGLYKFKNGNFFIGQWNNNKPNGKGTFETKNKIYSGIWKDGRFFEITDIVSKYQSGEINENIDFNFKTLDETIDVSKLDHINVKMMVEIN